METCSHFGPSSIGIDTIYKSGGNIPEVFLRGCGVPDNFIEYMRSLVGQKLDIYSCFISYSHADEEFAQRLHSALQSCGVRCWYAPHDMQGGKKIYDQIDSAIRVHDKTLLCLSENSMGSKWVETEIRRTRKAMDKTGKQKLFPISIVDDFGRIKEWECFDANTGSDMADEVREFYIPDFSNWKDHDSFQREFEKLLRDLKRDA
ncbi:toll/interleukin-1 receptor domain-containing protein [Desulfatibacillum aliphaticivorans]|uniref:toll/interleukin-1 receptor domain-containing protein n=1 Tax=Desulfatibacillum aliphaticivorans TaxID=218208 RepID=UPI001D05A6C1|nr:toll/interleukin-1 receptor domain-containing protein [Desulfatibacillum aliphaticivorans]